MFRPSYRASGSPLRRGAGPTARVWPLELTKQGWPPRATLQLCDTQPARRRCAGRRSHRLTAVSYAAADVARTFRADAVVVFRLCAGRE